ncbi:MAG: SGNH/GDSL hydrolase family protein [Rikenellaceae bacterium]
MNKLIKTALIVAMTTLVASASAQVANTSEYLSDFKNEMTLKWPKNRTLNVVFHGHSVPTGYGATPAVNTLEAYPHMLLVDLKKHYRTAVINVITTSIGGEQAEHGETRFESEVLTHRPDVLFIDYALNDRNIGIERSETAWRKMVEAALAADIKVILMTPTPDLNEDILSDKAPLQLHSEMIRRLAAEYKVGLVDSYRAFKKRAKAGEPLKPYMSQNNHPNAKGHEVVAALISPWFM